MADDGIFGMLSGMFGGGQAASSPTTDANGNPVAGAPMQILPQVQQDAMAQPGFLDMLKAGLAKNGPQAFSGLANQVMAQNKPAQVQPLQQIQFPQARQPVYGSMIPPRIGYQ